MTEPARRRTGAVRLGVGLALSAVGGTTALLYAVPSLALRHPLLLGVTAFTPYAVAAWGGALLCLLPSRRAWTRVAAVAATAGLLAQLWWTRPYWPAPSTASPAASAATVVTANLRCDQRGLDDLVDLTHDVQPDLVIVHGVYEDAAATLAAGWRDRLPHRTWHPMPTLPECGTAVFSRDALTVQPPVGHQPVVRATVDDHAVVLLPVDFPTPTKGVDAWLTAFADLTAAAHTYAGAGVIAAGDFNAVREHGPMRDLLHKGDLHHAAETTGAGWQPTFPANRWFPPLIALDHVMTDNRLTVTGQTTERLAGQAHLALVTRITMAE